MLRSIPLTRAAGMGPLPEMLEEAGGQAYVNRAFTLSGLPATLVHERHHWVPLSFLADLYHFGSQILDDPLFGLHVGQRMPPEQFGKWAVYGLQAPTLEDMMKRLEAALNVHTHGVSFRMTRRGNGLVAWEYSHSGVSERRFIQHSDHIVPVAVKAIRRFQDTEFKPVRIEAPYSSAPRAAADREALTSVPWSFGNDTLAIVLPEDILSAPRRLDPKVQKNRDLDAEIAALVERSRQEVDDIAMRVEVIMLLRVMDRKSDIEGLSRLLGLSTRALQRGLAELGESYRKMLTRVRLQRAHDLLERSRDNLTAIAFELGYSDPAHFTRAYKKHFGYPPSLHRINAS